MSKKYTIEYLKSLLDRDNATLIGEYDKLNSNSLIKYKCQCSKEHSKRFIILRRHKAYCKDCTKKNSGNINSNKKLEKSNDYWKKIIEENKLICSKCNIEKSLEHFYKNNESNFERYEKQCIICNRLRKSNEKYKRKENGSLEYNLICLLKEINRRTNLKNKSHLINIDIDYLKKLYDEQKGLCKYSARKMTFKIHCLNHISVDRIDNNKWYEKGNIAFCCSFVNKMKNDITLEEFKLFVKDINSTLNL